MNLAHTRKLKLLQGREAETCMIALERRLDRRGIGPDSHTRWRAFNDGLTDGVQLGRQLSPTSAGGAA
jgi:hypothetical protein